MIGKKNIVFGFIFLALTAALGPLMVDMYQDYGTAVQEKQGTVGRLQSLKENNFEEELEPLTAMQIAQANTDGILSINKLNNTELGIDMIKGGPHAHGNLEALLNIVVGLVLCFLAISTKVKQLISWLFILGTVLHSGMLYLERVFELTWATSYLNSTIGGIGPIMLLAGLLLTGLVAIKGLKSEVVKD
jgi:uncharacterized membrane protein YgdD (TMEM256/DUF423 family)